MNLNTIIRAVESFLYPFRVLSAYFNRFFGRAFGGQRRSFSLAFRLSLAFFFCLAIFITVAVFLRRTSGDGRYQLLEFTSIEILNDVIFYLIAVGIAILVYLGVRLATRDKPSLYPEIDRCWNSFDSWREKQSLSWFEFNRYFVLGSNLSIATAMHAEMHNKKVDALPSGANEWMHWYGTTESFYLHLKKVSHTNQRLEKIKSRGRGAAPFADGSTLQVSVGVPGWSEDVHIGDATQANEVNYGKSVAAFGNSLDPNESIDSFNSTELIAPIGDRPVGEAEIFSDEDDTPAERLEYLAKLMGSSTEGGVPFHGVVVAIPFDKFIQGENYKTISAAVRKDLLDLRASSRVVFPVAFVFTSMEKDQGFPKLQNLLGKKRAATGRFGAGCQVEDVPTIEMDNLELQVSRACSSFEDWVINRWSKGTQLARAAQNKELYRLTIRIRQQFQRRLRHLLQDSLIWDPSESPDSEGADISLAGCYFASTGDSEAERGFLAGVFAKCEEFSQTSSWAESAIAKDRLFSIASSILFLLSLIMIIGVAVFLCLSVWG